MLYELHIIQLKFFFLIFVITYFIWCFIFYLQHDFIDKNLLHDISIYSMTLTKSEQGYPRPIEHIGVPKSVRNEKGWYWPPHHTTPVHYPWHKNPYLEERKEQLKDVITELDPHRPVCSVKVVYLIDLPYNSNYEIFDHKLFISK